LLDFLQIAQADVMGFSNGGSIVLRLGLRHPAKVRTLVPISSLYRRDGMPAGFWDSFKNASLAMMPKALREFDLAMNGPEHLQQMFDQDLTRMASFIDWPDEDLSRIVPTLIVVGDQDIVTIEHSLKMARLIKGGRLMVAPGNHGGFIGQLEVRKQGSSTPASVMQLVEAFLNE
jgi:pimeloyl-ACP methyl ester carboxylesterase